MKEALVRKHGNLNDLNKQSTSGDNLNENVGEQKLNCPLYEGPSEPSVHNSRTGDNKFTINNYPHPSIKYHFGFQKAYDGLLQG